MAIPTLVSESLFKQDNSFVQVDNTPVAVTAMYKYAGENLGYISRYPTYAPERDNEDFYAKQQSGWDKVANTALSYGVLTTNTFLNHFASYGRQASSVTNQDWSALWDDEFGKRSAELLTAISDINPIYETKEQQALKNEEGGALTSLKQYIPFTGRAGNAWAELAGQIGFMTGTMLGVVAENVALDASIAFTGGATSPLAAEAAVTGVAKIAKSMYSLLKLDRGITTIKGAGETANAISKLTRNPAFNTYRLITASQGESSIEANQASIDHQKNMLEKFGVGVTEEDKKNIAESAKKVGNTVFNWNMPVLMVSNALTIGSLFKMADLGKAAISAVLKEEGERVVAKKFGELTMKEALYPQMGKIWGATKKVGAITGIENFSEGAEEVLQGIGSRAAQHQYDLFNSKGGEGIGVFVAGLADEASKTFSTREGWNEFFSGYLTGHGIKGFTYTYNRLSGKAKKEQEIRAQATAGAEDTINSIGDYLTSVQNNSEPNTRYLKEQAAGSEGQEAAIATGDTKSAKDYQTQSKASLFKKTIRFGTSVANDMFDLWGQTVEEMQKTNPTEAEKMLGGRTVSEVVEGLKKDNKAFAETFDQLDKNIGNPYNKKQEPLNWQLFEDAKMLGAEIEYNSRDSKNRMKGIQKSLTENFGVDEALVSAMLDGSQLIDSINTVKQTLQLQQESLKNATTAQEKSILEKEISKTEEKLALLSNIKEGAFDDKGTALRGEMNPEERAAMFIKAYYGENEASVPYGVLENVGDLLKLEAESEGYLSLYNLLSNKEYFNRFGESYVKRANTEIAKKSKEVADKTKEASKKEILPDEKYTPEEVDTALNGTTAKADVLDLIEEVEGKKLENGTYEHNGEIFETPQELAKKLIEEKGEEFKTNLEQENEQGETAEAILEKALNFKRDEPLESGVELRENTPNPTETFSPKPKSVSEKESFFFGRNSSGNTLMHYFDLVVSRLWSPNISGLRQRLTLHNQTGTLNFLDKAFSELGHGSRITIINLADDSIVPLVNNTEIMTYNDGVRFFIVTKEGDTKEIISRNLNLDVSNVAQDATIVRSLNGNAISSPFRGVNGITIESDNAIHKLRKGDEVVIRIADNAYNRDLQQQLNEGAITKEQYTDKLVIVAESNNQIVGVLRAGDFLFESEEMQEQITEFRQIFEGRELGDKIGFTPVNGVETARGLKYENGKVAYTTINEYKPENYNTSFYFVMEDGKVVDENGDLVDSSNFDRKDLRPNGVYMKVEGKNNNKNHTVQLYRSDSDSSIFTQEEFTSGDYKTIAQTNLSNEPIISKRLIVSLKQIKDAPHKEVIEKEVKETTKAETKPTTSNQSEIEAKKADIERRRQENDTLGKSILQKLGYKNENRLPNGNVKGGQAGWKIRFNIKNPKTGESYYDGKGTTTLLNDDYNKRAETLINFLLNYFGSNEKADSKNLQKHYVLEDKDGTRREPFKHFSGGEIGESDFTIYIGSADDVMKFISDIRTSNPEILKLLHTGNKSGDISIDDIFKGRIEGSKIGFSGYHAPTNLNKVTGSNNFTFNFNQNRVNINYNGNRLSDITIFVEGSNRGYIGVFDKNLKNDFPELYKNIRNIVGFQLYGNYLQGSNNEFLKLTGTEEINAKYNAELKDLEQSLKETTKAETTPENEKQIEKINKEIEKLQVKLNALYAKVELLTKKVQAEIKAINDTSTTKARKTKKVTAAEDKLSIQTAPIYVEIEDIDGKIIELENQKEALEFIEIELEDTNGNIMVVSGAAIGENGVTVQVAGEPVLIPTDEVTSISEVDKKEEVGQTNPEDSLQGMTEEEGKVWLKENAEKGDTYVLEDGSRIEVLSEKGQDVILRITKGETEISEVNEEDTPPSKEQDTSIINLLQLKFFKYGLNPERVFMSLLLAYKKSIIEGAPITNIDDLLDNSELTPEEIQSVGLLLTPVFRITMWQFLTGAETIYDNAQQEKWDKFKEGIKSIVADAESMEADNPPTQVQHFVKNKMIDELKKAFEKAKIGIRDFDVVKTFSLEQWKSVVRALKEAIQEGGQSVAEAFFKMGFNLAKLGLNTYSNGLTLISKVDRASLGRNPEFAGAYNNIFTDYRMAQRDKLMVRNEKDGLFIEVSPSKKKVSSEIRNLQKDLLSLLGLNFSVEYLNAYQKINGNFTELKNRATAEKERRENSPDFSLYETSAVEVLDKKTVLSGLDAEKIKVKGVNYFKVMQLNPTESIFVKEGETLTRKEINKIVKNKKQSVEYFAKKDNAFAETLKKVSKIKKTIEEINCN